MEERKIIRISKKKSTADIVQKIPISEPAIIKNEVKNEVKNETPAPPKADAKKSIITLKRITHTEVYDLLLSGHFIDKQIKQSVTINERIKISKEFSDNPNAGIFISDPNRKNSVVLCSTNQKEFDYYAIFSGKSDNSEKMCDWCRIKFTHKSKGIAIAYKELYYEGRMCRIFWIYGCHCDERCALAEIEEEEKKATHLSSLDLPSCRTMTNFLYSVTTGNDPNEIRPRCYWRLLKRNGGSIDDEDEPRIIFKETGNIYLLPAKTLFEKYEL